MTTFLIYGKDACGKSSQMFSICEASESAIVISLEVKNRKLYHLDQMGKMTDETPCEVIEPLVLEVPPSYAVVPVETFNSMGKVVERILNSQGPDGKKKVYKTVVIDGISDISRWAEKVVLKELQKKWPDTTAIGKENLAAWTSRNNLVCLPMERLATWAEMTGASVFFTTLMKAEYINNAKSGYTIDIQERIRDKACDVRICLSRDGRGYTAKFEKEPDWATKADAKGVEFKPEVTIARGGLYIELMKRGLL